MDFGACEGRRHRLKERGLYVSFDVDFAESEVGESCRICAATMGEPQIKSV